MNKTFLSVILLAFLILATSCRKTIDPSDEDGVSFIVRLPSISQARFEVRCVSEDVILDVVSVQSPSALYFTEEFHYQLFTKDEVFFVGNHEAEDGLWLITFIGTSAETHAGFHIIVPYEMVIAGDDNDE